MMKSFNLTLSQKHFICPSILNDSFAGYSNLGCRSLPFMTWNTSFQPLLACKVSFEKSADSLIIYLGSTFPTLFLPSPCLFSTYHLCYLFSVPLPPSPSHSLIDNPHVLVVCLVCSRFCFMCGH